MREVQNLYKLIDKANKKEYSFWLTEYQLNNFLADNPHLDYELVEKSKQNLKELGIKCMHKQRQKKGNIINSDDIIDVMLELQKGI